MRLSGSCLEYMVTRRLTLIRVSHLYPEIGYGDMVITLIERGRVMRSVIYGALFTIFLASAGTVQAANDLDGKALLCYSTNRTHPVYGLVFDKGKVSRWQVKGYSKVTAYNRTYSLHGTERVYWNSPTGYLDRETLKVGNNQCSISTKTEIFQKLDEIVAAAKKKNKI